MTSNAPEPGTRLSDLVGELRGSFELTLVGPSVPEVEVTRCLILDSAEVEGATGEMNAQVVILPGLDPIELESVLPAVLARGAQAVVVRAVDGDHRVREVVQIPVLVLSPMVNWSGVIDTITRFAHAASERVRARSVPEATFGDHTDLFGLARTLGDVTGTLISIEDDQGRVLAFSPFSEQADPIRRATILGREPPARHIAELRAARVYQRLSRPRTTVELPGDGDFRRRLGAGMLDPTTGALIGTIWAQETATPFADDLHDDLVAAAVYAARLVSQTRLVHTVGTELVQRILAPGAPSTFVQQLSLVAPTTFTLVGFECVGDPLGQEWLASAEAVALVSMHANAMRDHAMVAPHNGRLYAILPGPVEAERSESWARRTLIMLDKFRSVTFRAAMSSSLSASSIADARAEVERVCETTAYTPDLAVVTLHNQRTAVLLGECLRSLPQTALVEDPRFQSLVQYDESHNVRLLETVDLWLTNHGDIATTARLLLTHPNTIRYRIARVEKVSKYDLTRADDRLLLQLQIRLWTLPSVGG